MNQLKSSIGNVLHNIPGWRTRRKIVVIESDDWGSERTPSREVYNYLLQKGLRVDLCPFSMYDSIESNSDLVCLFDVLMHFKDSLGNYPVITANFNLANPDFSRISESNFTNYLYLTYPQTLLKYPDRDKVIELIIKTGISEKIFFPQYHYREHLNKNIWLEQLSEGHRDLMIGFNAGVYGLSRAVSNNIKRFHLASLIYRNENERIEVYNSLKEGAMIFKDTFGYIPMSFIAPVYIWNSEIERQLRTIDIRIIQGGFKQKIFRTNNEYEFYSKYNYLGKVNKHGQIYLTRNCIFEPSIHSETDNVNNCINQIKVAFRMNKPAIISSHRLNFIGAINKLNRERSLDLLSNLITKMLVIWPDIEFLSSVELGNLILDSNEK